MTPQLRRHFAPFSALKLVKNLRFLLLGGYQSHFQHFLGRGESFVNDISKPESKASTGFEFTRRCFLWFPVIPPHTLLPSASREVPSYSPQKDSPQDSHGKGSTTHPHPTPQPPHTPTTPTQQEREGKTDLSQIDQNSGKTITPEKTINAHPKTINAPFAERGVYGFP